MGVLERVHTLKVNLYGSLAATGKGRESLSLTPSFRSSALMMFLGVGQT